jgi:predicted nucleic acid-binding protein
LLCDDLRARHRAEAMGCAVAGTLGILLWAARSGTLPRDEARSLIATIPHRTTLHVRLTLVAAALASLDE